MNNPFDNIEFADNEPFLKVCNTCIEWFDITRNKCIEVAPGDECEYCTDLTGRPNYIPT